MDPKKNLALNGTVYVLALVGTCVAEVKGWHGVEFVCRPLMMIVLSSWFFFNSRRVGDRFTLLVQVGLFFSLIGDVALMCTYRDDFYFLIGLGCFFLALLCYAFAFGQNAADVGGFDGMFVSILIGFCIGTYAFFFTWDVTPHLDDGLGLPVIAFVCATALMGITAGSRYRRTYPRSFWLILAGALFLLASSSMMVWDRFRLPMRWASTWIICAYAAGQFLIAAGALAHVLDPDNLRRREALTT